MSYPTASEILGIDADQVTADDQRRWREAIAAIEQFCRQRFDSTGQAETVEIDGNQTSILYLPKRLASLESVSMNGNALGAPLSVSPEKNRLAFTSKTFGTWADRQVAEIEYGQRPTEFAIGEGNIAVTGIWGWTNDDWDDQLSQILSPAIKMVMDDLKRVDESALADTVKGARTMGVGSISQGGLSVDLSGRETNLSRRVKILLSGHTPSGEPLRWPLGAGVLV